MLYLEIHLQVGIFVARSKSDLGCKPAGLLRRDSAAHTEVPDVVCGSLGAAIHLNRTKPYGTALK